VDEKFLLIYSSFKIASMASNTFDIGISEDTVFSSLPAKWIPIRLPALSNIAPPDDPAPSAALVWNELHVFGHKLESLPKLIGTLTP